MGALSPLVSEFATTEDAEAYDRWLRAKVEASLADSRPSLTHDEVMKRAHEIIQSVSQPDSNPN